MEVDFMKIFPNANIGELKEDEYFGTEGLPYCNECKTPRYFKIDTAEGKQYIMRGRCKCQEEEFKRIEAEERKRKRIEDFKQRQKLSMLGAKYLDARFQTAAITENNKDAYQKCKNYVLKAKEVLKHNIGLYIYGDNSSGKTYLTACMCNYLVEEGYSCVYTNVPTMLAEIQKSFNYDNAMGQADLVTMLQNKSFVFIDDLGKEFLGREFNPGASKFAEKVLLEVLNARYNNGKPTVFTSNYSLSELTESFNLDKAIIERINEMATRMIKLEGDDFRTQVLEEKSKLAKSLGI